MISRTPDFAAERNALSLQDAQRVELDRRLDSYELDRDPGRPAEAALQEIRKRLQIAHD